MLNYPTNSSRSSGLDIMRFCLALYVLIWHHAVWSRHYYGTAAYGYLYSLINFELGLFRSHGETDIAIMGFIVLGGYCIHRNGFRAGNINIKQFILKRFWRIFPLFSLGSLWGALVFYFFCADDPKIYGIAFTDNVTFADLLRKLTGLVALLPSLQKNLAQGNAPLATVAVEMWIYALYPLAMLIVARFGDLVFWLLLIPLFIVGVFIVGHNPQLTEWWNFMSLLGFSLYWYIGVNMHSDRLYKVLRLTWPVILGTYLGLTLIFTHVDAAPVTELRAMLYPFLIELRKIACALLIGLLIRVIDDSNWQLPKVWDKLFGCSYSLYSLHGPIVLLSLLWHWTFYCTVAIALTVAVLSYNFIEKPLMYRR
jgi:peptidoglycan/LPS O-acetylase OafA/YrhL